MRDAPQGFKEFFDLEFSKLRDFAYVICGSWTEAEELAQEAMVRTFHAWSRIRDRENPGVYARTVLVNRRRTLFRRGLLAAKAEAEPPEELSPADSVEDRAVIWEALRMLPQRSRAAIVLRYYGDLSEAQTAAVLGCAVGTVKSLVHKGLSQLRVLLKEAPSMETGEPR